MSIIFPVEGRSIEQIRSPYVNWVTYESHPSLPGAPKRLGDTRQFIPAKICVYETLHTSDPIRKRVKPIVTNV